MMDTWFGIIWDAWSNWRTVFPLFVFAILLLCVRWLRQKQYVQRMVAPEYADRILYNTSFVRRTFKALLYAIAITCVAIALLRPQWGQEEQAVTQEGRDVVIALDISRSMLAQDVTPNRLTQAKEKIRHVVNQLDAERVALVIFAGDAVVQCPLTRDHGAFSLFLDGITPETITAGTTAIENALRTSAHVFEQHGLDGRQRLLMLVTDAEDFQSNNERMRQLLQDKALRLFVMGIGSHQGAPIPEYDDHGNHTGYKRDKHGNIVISRCDTQLAQQLAHACDGVYVHARDDESDVQRIVHWVQHFEKTAGDEMSHTGYIDRYQYYAIPALIALCLEWLL